LKSYHNLATDYKSIYPCLVIDLECILRISSLAA